VRNVVDSDAFRQPVVRSGGAVRRPAAPPRRTPFPEVESLVALVSPSPTKEVLLSSNITIIHDNLGGGGS
jgi:hypothetical protein